MRRSVFLALGGLALAVQGAAAQGACDDIKRFFLKPPKLGEWADVRMDMQKDEGKKPVLMRVAAVDKEERDGVQMYRMQMTTTNKDGKKQIMQMLAPWGPKALEGDYDTEMVMKMGDQPAMIMPIKAGQDGAGISDVRKHCAKMSFVGEESVTVPAGTFDTRHYTGPDGDSWVSPKVPAWRMVKMVTKKGDTMVLTATGDGATNEITEQPVDMKAMMGRGMIPGMRGKDKDQANGEAQEEGAK